MQPANASLPPPFLFSLLPSSIPIPAPHPSSPHPGKVGDHERNGETYIHADNARPDKKVEKTETAQTLRMRRRFRPTTCGDIAQWRRQTISEWTRPAGGWSCMMTCAGGKAEPDIRILHKAVLGGVKITHDMYLLALPPLHPRQRKKLALRFMSAPFLPVSKDFLATPINLQPCYVARAFLTRIKSRCRT